MLLVDVDAVGLIRQFEAYSPPQDDKWLDG